MLTQLNLVSTMYSGNSLTLDEEEEKKGEEVEESKEPASPMKGLSAVLYSEDEMANFDYAGVD